MEKLRIWEEQVRILQKKIDEQLSLAPWKFTQGIKHGERLGSDDQNWVDKNQPFSWSKQSGPAYFSKRYILPAEIEGIPTENSRIDLTFLFPSGVELFIDGEKVYSHDYWADKIAHPYPLMAKAQKGDKRLIVFKSPQGDGLGYFWATLNVDRVEGVFFELQSILYQLKFAFQLAEETQAKSLKKCAQKALDQIHLQDLEKRRWDKLLPDLRKAEAMLEIFRKYAKNFRIHLVSHAHIDMNWLWNYDETIDICLRDFATMNKLMDKYPDLTFSQSQAHIYKIVEEHDRPLFRKVLAKIKEGRWEATSSSWVEGDLNMADGESIVRHILYANKYTAEKLETQTDVFWSPDTFGHPATTPSILRSAGLKYYYFMRCGKSMPLFRWQGPDGQELIAFNSSYLNSIKPETVMSAFLGYHNRYDIRDFLFVFGVGDHGGGPTEADIQRKKRLEQKPVFPTLEFSTTQRFFTAVEKQRNTLPVVSGELNTIFEGCYSTHSDIKKANRECENLLFALEALGAVVGLKGGKISEKAIEELWQKTMFNQFHDILDGSSIHSAYEYSNRLANEVQIGAGILKKQAVKRISKEGGKGNVVVFNPLGWERTSLIQLPPTKKGSHNSSFTAENLHGFGYKTLSVAKVRQDHAGRMKKPVADEYENDFYRIKIDTKTGLIRKLYDKRNRCDVLSPCQAAQEDASSWWAEKAGNLLSVSWEKPHFMSAWIIGNIYRVDNLLDAETVAIDENRMQTTVKIKRRYMDSEIHQRIILYPGLPYIDFENEIHWRQQGNDTDGIPLLRVNFNIKMKNPKAFFEVPFGAVQREALPKEYPALKWAGLNRGNYWVALLNKDKYGYYVDSNNLSLTLLRNPHEPDAAPDCGLHKISYRLFFGKADLLQVAKAAWEYNIPPIVAYGQGKGTDFCPFTIKGDILPTCFKKALGRDTYILRLVEVCGKKQQVEIEFTLPPNNIYLADAAEQRITRINQGEGNKTKLSANPHQILTLDMEF